MLSSKTLRLMALTVGAGLGVGALAGPASSQKTNANANAAPTPSSAILKDAPCMVDVDGEEVCTKTVDWKALTLVEKQKLATAIQTARAEAIAAQKAAAEKADAAKPAVRTPAVTQPTQPIKNGLGSDPCPACGMG